MKKKPVIITVLIVAVAAILIGGGVYLYPHVVERTISQVVDNDMTDVVKIEMQNGSNGNKVELSDKESIEEITGLFKDMKVRKCFNQWDKSCGWSLGITMTTAENEEINLSVGQTVNGKMYEYNDDTDIHETIKYLKEKYELNNSEENE